MIDSRYERRPRYGGIPLSELRGLNLSGFGPAKKRSRQKQKPSQLEDTLAWQIRVAGLPAPEREYAFCFGRKYRADFAFVASRLIIECEGGVWSRGRHTRGAGFNRDCDKYNLAALLGWRVLRFTGKHIRNGSAITMIERALKLGDL